MIDGAPFCHQCGTRRANDGSGGAAPAAARPSQTAVPARPNDSEGPETELWRSAPSGKAYSHYWIGSAVFAAVMIYVALQFENIRTAAFIVASLPMVYTVGLVAFVKLSTRYRLTTQRVFIETGILNKKLMETELYKIDDVCVSQNLLQRLFNVGVVKLAASDADSRMIELEGVENPVEVKEIVRAQVRRHQQKVLKTLAV